MLILGLLLVALAVVVGFYAQANGGTHDVTLFGNQWSTYDWVPVAIAAGAGALLFVLAALYMTMRLRRLRQANAALQRDVDLLKLERATKAMAMTERADAMAGAGKRDKEVVGHPGGAPDHAPDGAPEKARGGMVPPWPSASAPSA